jgi:hypothetical protein
MRIREPKTTALIFASGKMVCTGAKSETESRLAAKKYARIIQKLGNTEATFKVPTAARSGSQKPASASGVVVLLVQACMCVSSSGPACAHRRSI